jgi:hypothetical protein
MISIIAYLDPGTGSIIIQSIVAGLLGIVVAIKLFWQRIVGFFRFRKSEPAGEEKPEPETKD